MGGFAEKNGRAGSPLPADSLAETAWPMVRLGDVCEEIRERIPSSKVSREGYITTDNMVKGCGGVRISESLPVGVGLVKYQAGDILLSNIRPYLKKVWLADHGGGCSSDVIVFRVASSGLSPEYLYRALSQDAFFDYSMQNVSGTKMPRGKRDWIKQFEFPLPPLSVQREIVERLEKELGETEKITAGFRRIAENAEAEFKAELDETFKALEEDVSRGGARTRRVRLGDVCETITDGDWIESKDQSSDGIRLVQTGNIGNGRFEHKDFRAKYISTDTFERLHCTEIFQGDVLVSRLPEPVGRACIVEGIGKRMITAVDCTIIRFKGLIDSRYFIAYSQSGQYRSAIVSLVTGSTRSRISRKNLESILVLVPPLPIQHSIVSRLDTARERCDKINAEAEKGLKAAENLRKAILKEAFEQ